MTKKKGVLIVDDHPVLRRGLAMLIGAEPDMKVCGEAEDVNEGLRAVAETQPDIVLVDISLKKSDGIQLIRQLKVQYPRLPVLAISMHDESVYAERALRAGARGYITKQAAEENIVHAMRHVLAGKVYLSEPALDRVMKKFAGERDAGAPSPAELLSDREFEVFQLIGRGVRASQIAEKLHLSVKTVETYQAHIKSKLGLESAWDLGEYAVAWMKAHMRP
jgi:DNA-binding NarL/FixJ family response regulator